MTFCCLFPTMLTKSDKVEWSCSSSKLGRLPHISCTCNSTVFYPQPRWCQKQWKGHRLSPLSLLFEIGKMVSCAWQDWLTCGTIRTSPGNSKTETLLGLSADSLNLTFKIDFTEIETKHLKYQLKMHCKAVSMFYLK